MTDCSVDVSVVIGFKDWGVDRLRLAVATLIESFGTLSGEVIVSDYGSTTCPDAREIVESIGARYVYTSTDGVWSRSRALNAGFAVSTGSVLISTDADMLFSPRSLEVVAQRILNDPNEALALQCRDLPEGLGSDYVEQYGLQWDTFAQRCAMRPRWGMGGMMAVSRQAFLDVRGFDERMVIYGGEDLDFAQRVRRSGRRVSWIEHPEVRMYHMWHPSSRSGADQTPEGRAAIAFNRSVYLNDTTFVRNLTRWRHQPADAAPAASVVIVTRDRAQMLRESIHSALAQTVKDIEVIVVDDGSQDDTKAVVEAIKDERLSYYRRPALGVAAARNFAALQSRSRFTVVHDDDDLMMPDRVERHLAVLQAGDTGTYGGWIDFDDRDGSIVAVNPGKPYSIEALLFGAKVFAHGTLMIETRLLSQVKYDERFRSGSDYNLAVRLARLGVRFRHTGHVHIARRMHAHQMTTVSSNHQQSAGRWAAAAALGSLPHERHAAMRAVARKVVDVELAQDRTTLHELLNACLPDRLALRDIHVTFYDHPPETLEDRLTERVQVKDLSRPAEGPLACAVLRSATWEDLAQLRAHNALITLLDARAEAGGRDNVEPLSDLEHGRLLATAVRPEAPVENLLADKDAESMLGPDSWVAEHWQVGEHELRLVESAPRKEAAGATAVSAAPAAAAVKATAMPPATLERRETAAANRATAASSAPASAKAAKRAAGGQAPVAKAGTDSQKEARPRGPQAAPAKRRAGSPPHGASVVRAPHPSTQDAAGARPSTRPHGSTGSGHSAKSRPVRDEGATVRRQSKGSPGHPAGRPAVPPRSASRAMLSRFARLATPGRLLAAAVLAGMIALAAALASTGAWLTGLALVGAAAWAAILTVAISLTGLRVQLALTHLDSLDSRTAATVRRRLQADLEPLKSAPRRLAQQQRRQMQAALKSNTEQVIKRSNGLQSSIATLGERFANLDEDLQVAVDRISSEVRGVAGSATQQADRRHSKALRAQQRRIDALGASSDHVLARGEQLDRDLRAAVDHITSEVSTSAQRSAQQAIRAVEEGQVHTQEVLRSTFATTVEAVEAAAVMTSRQQKQDLSVTTADIEALINLFHMVDPQTGAPPLGGWAAAPALVLELVNELLELRPSLVVECGSGASTVWLAAAAKRFDLNTRIVALEHDQNFAARTRQQLTQRGLDLAAEVRTAPLQPVETGKGEPTPWYDLTSLEGLEDIGILFVDGPPGAGAEQARWPAVPLLLPRMAASCSIVLDDTDRADERAIVQGWRQMLVGFECTDLGVTHGAVSFKRRAAVSSPREALLA